MHYREVIRSVQTRLPSSGGASILRLDGFWGQYSILQALLYGLGISLSSHVVKIIRRNSEGIVSMLARNLQPDRSFVLRNSVLRECVSGGKKMIALNRSCMNPVSGYRGTRLMISDDSADTSDRCCNWSMSLL
jgi:hypothetical protein